MKYQLLQSLLPYLDAYEASHNKSGDLSDFAVWLSRETTEDPESGASKPPVHPTETTEAQITRMLLFLTRYARVYARKALDGSPLGSMDEFQYLVSLQISGSLSKTDLINRNRHEKPTGMDIIRRLLTLGLIAQAGDPDDRRSKLLVLSPQGAALVQSLQGRMGLVSHILAGNLPKTDRIHLLQTLESLELFHQVIQAKTKGETFDGIIKVIMGR
jgi:DNA-binding MarR family transcriptional regulator